MMSDRSTGRVDAAAGTSPGQTAASVELAGGRLASVGRRRSARYLTAVRLAALQAELIPTDWAVIETVRTFGVTTGPQLAALHWGEADSEARAARRALGRLRQDAVLDALDRRIGGVRAGSSGLVYRLGQAGVRLLGSRRRPLDEPGLHHLLHSLAIVDVRVWLAQAERRGEVEVLRFDAEPDCWRSYTGRHGEPVVLKPDAFCELRISDRRRLWFLEVDRGTVSTATLKAKLTRYAEYLDSGGEQAEHGAFPRVVWVATSERRAAHLRELCARENRRLDAELHRLLADEWVPP